MHEVGDYFYVFFREEALESPQSVSAVNCMRMLTMNLMNLHEPLTILPMTCELKDLTMCLHTIFCRWFTQEWQESAR